MITKNALLSTLTTFSKKFPCNSKVLLLDVKFCVLLITFLQQLVQQIKEGEINKDEQS